jgi:pimeloyl-ACP methyl ester carboxylesterase
MDPAVRRGYFDGPFGQVHFRRAGTGRPVLLLHQSPLSSQQFLPAMPLLAGRGFDVVAIDMPGFGMSDPTPPDPGMGHFTTCVGATFDHFGWGSAPVVGHHTGAAVAAFFARESPGRVDALVLNGAPLLSDEEREFFRGFRFGPVVPQADGSHLLQGWNTRLRATPGWTDLAAMHRHYVDGLVSGATNWRAFPLVVGADLGSVLRELRLPVLLFTNTGEDLYAATRRAHALRPDFAYAELEGGTHDIVDEQPVAWAATVADYLLGLGSPR